MRLSIIIEWANTRLHGTSRGWQMLDVVMEQWQQLAAQNYPASLPTDDARFLGQFDPCVELLIVSADTSNAGFEQEVRRHVPGTGVDLGVLTSAGSGYHALKHFGAERASGDILLFLDSDVIPDHGWLAHLLGTFADPDIHVAFGQPYVPATNAYSQAFSLGWIYEPRVEPGELTVHHKLYPNNTAFRSQAYRQTGFPPLGKRSRGASSQVLYKLASQGISVWQNSNARVDHPAPIGFRHFTVRALAHARDYYMGSSEKRHIGGLITSLNAATTRLGRSYQNTFRYRKRIGMKLWQVPAVLVILTTFYGIWMLGGLVTHVSPNAMGRHFQV